MSRKRKSGFIYEGVDKKGIYRRCKFDYHKDREQLRKGTANAIAKQLKFENSKEMRNFIDQM